MLMKQSRPWDTTPEIEQIQIDCLRRKSPSERLQLAIELTQASRALLAVGVRRRHPEYNAEQVRLAVIRLMIPEKLFLAAYPHAKDLQP